MITAHEGRLFKFNIYSDKIDILVGKLNEETGKKNRFVTFSHGEQVHYEETRRKNFTEIIVPVKKLNKHKFIDAVKSQLLYLPGVKFYTTEGENRYEESFRAEVLYESENIVISNNRRFGRPHLLVVKDKSANAGICYNEIDYKELELEQRYGKVALKVQTRAVTKDENGKETLINEGIAVTPNREQVIWNDHTKEYLLKITRGVSEEAAQIIEKELKEEDFLRWINKAVQVTSNFKYGSVLHEISQMVDKSTMAPKFPKDKTIKLKELKKLFWGLDVRHVRLVNEWGRGGNTKVTKVHRDKIDSWHHFGGKNVFLKTEPTSHVKDRYIMSKILKQDSYGQHDQGFLMVETLDYDALLEEAVAKGSTAKARKEIEEKLNKLVEQRTKVLDLLKASEDIKIYDDVEVPDDFKVEAEETEAKIEELIKEETMSLEALRKANGQVVFFTPRPDQGWKHSPDLVMEKQEEKISDLSSIFERVYYGFDEDRPKLECACKILGRNDQKSWYNSKLAIVKIAKSNEKHFKTVGEHISKFFYEINNKQEVIVTQEVSDYITARHISKKLEEAKFSFFTNYGIVDERLASIYKHLVEFAGRSFETKYKLSTGREETEKEMLENLLKYAEFQQFVEKNGDDDAAIATKSKELFTVEGVKGSNILQMVELKRLGLLEEYAENIFPLFNEINVLTSVRYDDSVDSRIINMIRIILREYNLEPFDIPEELLIKKKSD